MKLLQRFSDGTIQKEKEIYEEMSPDGWWSAVERAMERMDLSHVEAIGLSSQVGTYLVNEESVISWSDPIGQEELAWWKEAFSKEQFLLEISMPHPNIVSYPLPRLRYIREHYPEMKTVCQPKDFICKKLTGNYVTDAYSWRGLANLETKTYSSFFLEQLQIKEEQLPTILPFTEVAGHTKEGIPVYVGLNDYYASLLGMKIWNVGDLFDITGTSEHFGILEHDVNLGTNMVSGPYLNHNVHYGVTASSGVSLQFGLQFSDTKSLDIEQCLRHNPPIFLPYLNGERAPIWDGDARGVYFGIQKGCSKEDMAYAVLEGVCFSLYHIYENMGCPDATRLRIAGGAAVNPVLNQLKAEMFGIPVEILEEHDTSALGACLVAELGRNGNGSFETLMGSYVKVKELRTPTGMYDAKLKRRYEQYKRIYLALKTEFQAWKE